MKKKLLVLLLALLCSFAFTFTFVGCVISGTTTPSLDSGEQGGITEPPQLEDSTPPSGEKKIPVNVYIDGEISDTIYADATTGKITLPSKPEDITTNSNSERYFHGWFTDASCITKYNDDMVFNGKQSIYGKLITVYPNSYEYDVNEGVATITGCNRYDADLVIPALINGIPVKSIFYNALSNRTQLRTVIICNGIETVNGFSGCSSLLTVVLPQSVTTIGSNAFSQCDRLNNINLPDGLTTIGNSAFLDCSNLTGIEIPSGVTTIGNWAFRNCGFLTSITIPSGVTSIGYGAFDGCINLTSVEIPSGVTDIGKYAFKDCSRLKDIYIPDSVTTIDEEGFSNCKKLSIFCESKNKPDGWNGNWNKNCQDVIWNCKEYGETQDGIIWNYTCDDIMEIARLPYPNDIIPATIDGRRVTSIGPDVFKGRSTLTSIEIPNSVISIDKDAFAGFNYISTVTMPTIAIQYIPKGNLKKVVINGGSIIDANAFDGCNALTSIEISKEVTRIGERAFHDCINLKGVYITDIVSWCKIEFGNDYANPLYFAKNLYLNNELVTELTIPKEVTSIGNYTFFTCKSLTSVEIPSGVTSIGSHSFFGCNNLTSMEIPETVTSIGYAAFYSCSSLTNIVIPRSVTSIDSLSFSDCGNMTSIVIPSSVTYVGDDAFYWCRNLTIYCEVDSEPNGWSSRWNFGNCPVVWGYKG